MECALLTRSVLPPPPPVETRSVSSGTSIWPIVWIRSRPDPSIQGLGSLCFMLRHTPRIVSYCTFKRASGHVVFCVLCNYDYLGILKKEIKLCNIQYYHLWATMDGSETCIHPSKYLDLHVCTLWIQLQCMCMTTHQQASVKSTKFHALT